MKERGIDFYTERVGQGPPLLWGHGLLTSIAVEDAIGLPGFFETPETFEWLRYDARGHGRSSATLDFPDYAWPELARDALALARALGEERLLFGGLSMGCATALHAAVLAPERVRGLLLVAPPTAWETRPRQAFVYRMMAALIEAVGLSRLCRLARWLSFGGDDSVESKMKQGFLLALEAADERAAISALRGAAESDLPSPDAIRAIDVPTLILAWRGDPVHPLSSARRLAELLPQSDLYIARDLREVRAWSARIAAFREEFSSSVSATP